MSDHPALIAGGGIAGLATAIALARSGTPCRVLERKAEFSEVGAGIQIGPNGTRVLKSLGVTDRLAQAVGVPRAIDVRDARSGANLSRLPLGDWIERRHGNPYWTAHRADLHEALLATARGHAGIEFVMGFEIASIAQHGTNAAAIASDGRRADGRFVIGADGVGSAVRRLAIADLPMQPAGRVAARAVIPMDAAPSEDVASAVCLWLAPKAHVVHYPVRGGRELAVVVVTQDSATPEGWGAAIEASTVLARCDGLAPALIRLLQRAGEWRQWTLLSAPRLPRWSNRSVVLVGDATGPFFPFLAQGGAMALEDAASLAAVLAASPDCVTAFERFEAVRRPRRERMIEAAARNGRIYHLDGAMALARNLALRTISGERVMAGYDWLYGYRA